MRVMRRTPVIFNVLATIAFAVFGTVAADLHHARVYNTYDSLVYNRVLVEKPTDIGGFPFDVKERIHRIGEYDIWFRLLGFSAAGACLVNGLAFFFLAKREKSAA